MVLTLKQDKIVIKTDRDIQRLESKIDEIIRESVMFSILEITTIINIEIIDVIQDKMRGLGLSSKIIDNTFLSHEVTISGNTLFFFVISNYISETGFAVAVKIEDGAPAYTVLPKPATAERPNPHLKYIIGGKVIYSKKSDIPVYPARQIIKKTIAEKTPKVQKEYNKKARKWIKSILRG